jgi:hypothetical protein
MQQEEKDLLVFSEENLLLQIKSSRYEFGLYRVRFYEKNGIPATEKTDSISEFYLYPSGGTLRDKNFNIVFYNARFDEYRGFIPPQKPV